MNCCWIGEVIMDNLEEVDWITFSAEAFSCGVEAEAYWAREA
jgi:hypothetical protein